MTLTLYNIPAGFSFVDALADGLLRQAGPDPLSLARMEIYLPTRRACRSLRDAFLRQSEGRPILLPRLFPLGDSDEEELIIAYGAGGEDAALPPAIAPLKRLFLLMRLIAAQGHARGTEQDFTLAQALARLMDQIYTEDLDLTLLPTLVDRAEFADHWQISLDFLSLLSVHWPAILKENGEMDAADRRNKIIKARAALWRACPPSHPVIAAGTTGSIPATAELLSVIARMPQGSVILPGLDQDSDDTYWDGVDDTHPQATLKNLLGKLDAQREDVRLWPACDPGIYAERSGRRRFTAEIMRPAHQGWAWHELNECGLTGDDAPIELYECDTPQEEAFVVALALRRVLEDPHATAALVTPDRALAARVAAVCRRWGIDINDSAGESLSATPVGSFLTSCLRACIENFRPAALLDFCKHDLCAPPEYPLFGQRTETADKMLLRGLWGQGGLDEYFRKCDELSCLDTKKMLHQWIVFLQQNFTPLTSLAIDKKIASGEEWCKVLVKTAESFCPASTLWSDDDGEVAAVFTQEFNHSAAFADIFTAHDFFSIFTHAMSDCSVRPRYGLHPRLSVLGQLEGRLVEANTVILSGLNEGTWPPSPSPDPWMSRPMRQRFGLPSPERSIALAAHDFAQNLCARNVIITRSLRKEGAPTVPARWIQRLDTVIQALNIPPHTIRSGAMRSFSQAMDKPHKIIPLERPCPVPPVDVRPRRLSVTKIERLMKDPYAVYASEILRLNPLTPLEQPLDAALRGDLLHKILESFCALKDAEITADSFLAITRRHMEIFSIPTEIRALWEPRMMRIGEFTVQTLLDWRKEYPFSFAEAKGVWEFATKGGLFSVTARADRLDIDKTGQGAAIIDYKSGGNFSAEKMKKGFHPQLPLEAVIMEAGGFTPSGPRAVTSLCYWLVNGTGENGGSLVRLADGPTLRETIINAKEGVLALVEKFYSENMAYYAVPRPDFAPAFNAYEHLERIREWTAPDEKEDVA